MHSIIYQIETLTHPQGLNKSTFKKSFIKRIIAFKSKKLVTIQKNFISKVLMKKIIKNKSTFYYYTRCNKNNQMKFVSTVNVTVNKSPPFYKRAPELRNSRFFLEPLLRTIHIDRHRNNSAKDIFCIFSNNNIIDTLV